MQRKCSQDIAYTRKLKKGSGRTFTPRMQAGFKIEKHCRFSLLKK